MALIIFYAFISVRSPWLEKKRCNPNENTKIYKPTELKKKKVITPEPLHLIPQIVQVTEQRGRQMDIAAERKKERLMLRRSEKLCLELPPKPQVNVYGVK